MNATRDRALRGWLWILFLLLSYGGHGGQERNGWREEGNGAILLASAQTSQPSEELPESDSAGDGPYVPPPSTSLPTPTTPPSTSLRTPTTPSSTSPPTPTTVPSASPLAPTTPPSTTTPAKSTAPSQGVGVNIGFGLSSKPLTASEMVAIVMKTKASSVKLFGDFIDTPEAMAFIDALAGTGIDVVIPVALQQIAKLASDYNASRDFVQSKVKVRLDKSIAISTIAVGNEVLLPEHGTTYWATIVPAMRNVYTALQDFGLHTSIKVITPLNFNALQATYPPSAGAFNQSYMGTIKPLLQFLNETGSSFMVNIYPFYPTRDPNNNIVLDFALGVPGSKVDTDPVSGLSYTNMIDMMMDALAIAIEKEGFHGMPVAIGEVGWPTGGHQIATVANAEKFNNYLVGQLMSKKGTPKRPGAQGWMQVYIFELLDEDLKPYTDLNGAFERHWGMYYMNGTGKYAIDLSVGWGGTASTVPPTTPTSPTSATSPTSPIAPITPSTPSTAPPASQSGPIIPTTCTPGERGGKTKSLNQTLTQAGGPNTYCVINDCASDVSIQLAIDWVCGQGQVGCTATQEGGPCFVPNTPVSHGSFLVNKYYASQGRKPSACIFNGAGMIIGENPSYGACIYN
ncbi:hypothetical protein CBR_g40325 [Chara braunii]|uniref:X8 domain-containing protein n=1 Tax=Chara braunii TaxID=69332 RepID=A0A388LTF8_CHABU|nr:hypothetical protein CBR_g40325 [Chara braunii]|eukprot:GBG85597.1 hypothetical protein CBR_g40325 [Chara braunii]